MDICKKADFMTPATMAQDGTLVRTLTSYVWGGLGAVAFIHKEPEIARYPIKSGQKYYFQNALVMEWTLKGDWRCNSGLPPNLIPIREAVGTGYPAGHHPPTIYGPTHIRWGPRPTSCWLPASPDASEASDLVQRCPSHVAQD